LRGRVRRIEMAAIAEQKGRAKPEERVDKAWLRPDEAAVYSGLGLTRVYHLIKTGVLPSARVPSDKPGSKRITHHLKRADIDTYLEKFMTVTK
jgi:excisionase family DNA binding protein